jgi:hypothetical protein
VVRRLVKLALAAWLVRWAAIELASYAGRHWRKPGRPPLESPRAPGRMPEPFER